MLEIYTVLLIFLFYHDKLRLTWRRAVGQCLTANSLFVEYFFTLSGKTKYIEFESIVGDF